MTDATRPPSKHKQRKAVSAPIGDLSIYLIEELGDARLRCAELKRYIDEGVQMVNKSEHKDHFFEVAGHLLHGIPTCVMKLEKALQATAMAAAKLDYEQMKAEIRPEKSNELDEMLSDIRIRQVERRSHHEDTMNPREASAPSEALMQFQTAFETARTAYRAATQGNERRAVLEGLETIMSMTAALSMLAPEHGEALQMIGMRAMRLLPVVRSEAARTDALHMAAEEEVAGEKESRFEEGKPADPTQNMSKEDAKKWKVEHEKNKDNFKASSDSDAHLARFPEGQSADPTKNMSEEDAKKWKEMHDKHKDNFKSAARDPWKV